VRGSEDAPLDLTVDVYVDGRADLVLPFGATYERRVMGGPTSVLTTPNLDAQRRHAMRIVQRGVGRTSGVRFRLGGLAPFTQVALRAFTDQTPSPETVFGPAAGNLVADLGAMSDPDGQAATLDTFFLGLLDASPALATFRRSLGIMVDTGGLCPVSDLAGAAGTSVRQLERLFARFLGLPPKTTARIVRFQAALRALMTDPGTALADVAHAAGYFDQAHFIRDFRAMTGGGVPRGYRGYYPPDGPDDFAPNVVVFVQDERSTAG